MGTKWFLITAAALVMSACSNSSPQIEYHRLESRALSSTAFGANPVQVVQTEIEATTTRQVTGLPDQVFKTPPGLKGSVLLSDGSNQLSPRSGGEVRMRVDYPGAGFDDGLARSAVYDVRTGQARAIVTSSGAIDAKVNAATLAQTLKPLMGSNSNLSAQSYTKMSALEFATQSELKGATVSPSSSQLKNLSAQRGLIFQTVTSESTTVLDAKNTMRVSSTFDTKVGAVTMVVQSVENADAEQTSTSLITYSSIPQLPNAVFPSHVEIEGTLTAKKASGIVKIRQVVDYTKIYINAVGREYFSVGGL